MKQKISLFLAVLMLLWNVSVPVTMFAQEAPPPPPPALTAPEAPTPPTPPAPPSPPPAPPAAPTPPPAPTAPTPPPAPSPTPRPSPSAVVSPQPNPSPTASTAPEETVETASESTPSNNQATPLTPQYGETTGSIDASHGKEDPYINTGNATAGAIVTNDVNSNLSGTGSASAGDINVGNTGNGAGSANSSDINTTNNSSSIQTNNANVNNNVNLGAISGKNDTSHNTGVDNTIITGDANTTATIINGVNTNIDGVKVVEFNVDDTHTGDIVLDFPQGSACTVTVCGGNGTIIAENSGNGADSQNNTGVTTANSDTSFQNNTANVVNDLVLVSDSGHNDASYNTGGNSSVTTGDANVVATVNNFVNNNISAAGEVLVAVVNIFGDLIGNILVPDYLVNGGGGTTAQNTGNGAGSTNTANVNTANSSETTQINDATIANNLYVDANTGGNNAENNTGGFTNGDNTITTGDATLDVNAINIANTNVVGDDVWWLVFVNDASGNWVGKIVGAPDGAKMAGSYGTEFIVTEDGTILAQNTGNGAGSTNSTDITTTNTHTTEQTNTANVTNNVTLVANTGSNEASYNTGGDSTISTGNANIMANILNFVNNNISGGRVMVSVINVFGSWMGSFVPAGEEVPKVAGGIGGSNVSSNQISNTNSSSNNESDSANTNTQNNSSMSSNQGLLSGFVRKTGSQPFGGVLGSHVENTEQPAAGQVFEDDTISVPENVKTAAAKTVIPSWFWRLFAASILLLIIKRIHNVTLQKRFSSAPKP